MTIPFNQAVYRAKIMSPRDFRGALMTQVLVAPTTARVCQVAHAVVDVEFAVSLDDAAIRGGTYPDVMAQLIMHEIQRTGCIRSLIGLRYEQILSPIFDMVDAVKRITALVWAAAAENSSLVTYGSVSVFHSIDWIKWFAESTDVAKLRTTLQDYVEKFTRQGVNGGGFFNLVSALAAEPVFLIPVEKKVSLRDKLKLLIERSGHLSNQQVADELGDILVADDHEGDYVKDIRLITDVQNAVDRMDVIPRMCFLAYLDSALDVMSDITVGDVVQVSNRYWKIS